MKKIFPAAIVISLLLISCVQSLYPLTDDKNQMVFKKELLGMWKEANGNSQYLVDDAGDNSYRVTIVEKNENNVRGSFDTSYLLMTLVSIKGKYFLDCFPDSNKTYLNDAEKRTANLILRVHYIFKVTSISPNAVEIGSIDDYEISKLIQQRKFSINYARIQDRALLVQQPSILRQKLTELETFPSAYQKTILTKQRL